MLFTEYFNAIKNKTFIKESYMKNPLFKKHSDAINKLYRRFEKLISFRNPLSHSDTIEEIIFLMDELDCYKQAIGTSLKIYSIVDAKYPDKEYIQIRSRLTDDTGTRIQVHKYIEKNEFLKRGGASSAKLIAELHFELMGKMVDKLRASKGLI